MNLAFRVALVVLGFAGPRNELGRWAFGILALMLVVAVPDGASWKHWRKVVVGVLGFWMCGLFSALCALGGDDPAGVLWASVYAVMTVVYGLHVASLLRHGD